MSSLVSHANFATVDLWLITSTPRAQEMTREHHRGLSIPQTTAERFALMINNCVDCPSPKEKKGNIHELSVLHTHGGKRPDFTTLLDSAVQWPQLQIHFIGRCELVTIVQSKHRFASILAVQRSTSRNCVPVSYMRSSIPMFPGKL